MSGVRRTLRLTMAAMRRVLPVLLVAAISACAPSAEQQRIRNTSKGKYDPKTGRLTEITYDRNKNGVVDTWVRMDGSRPLDATIDTDEDGKIDRWEYYDQAGKLVRVGESRGKTGKPDTFAYMGADGQVERLEFMEVSRVTGVEGVARREFFQGGQKVRGEEDTDGDGEMDRWESNFVNGRARVVEFDDEVKRGGKPAQRFTYDEKGGLVSIESAPDGNGGYKQKRLIKN